MAVAGSFLSGLEGAPLFPGFFLLATGCFFLLLILLEDNEEDVVDSLVGEGDFPMPKGVGVGGSRKLEEDLFRLWAVRS